MQPEIQVLIVPADQVVYATPDVTRLGTVEELTEGTAVAIQGDLASGPG